MTFQSIGVIGAGGWGTALAKLLADKGAEVTLWCHGEASYRDLIDRRENRAYLPGIELPASLAITRSLAAAGVNKRLIICAVPSHAVREIFSQARASCRGLTPCCFAAPRVSKKRALTPWDSFLLAEIFGADKKDRHGFLSGPTFAIEVARQLPAAVTVAAYNDSVAKEMQAILEHAEFSGLYFGRRGRGTNRRRGQKNVIAIAAGISDGLGLGHNARAALITRGLAEMTRLAVRLGADAMTLAGLPGLVDFGAHLHRRFEPQSHRRFTDCARQVAGGNYRRHPNRRRGRAQYPFAAFPGASARRRHANRRADVSGSLWR